MFRLILCLVFGRGGGEPTSLPGKEARPFIPPPTASINTRAQHFAIAIVKKIRTVNSRFHSRQSNKFQ